ncbi:hypothetical protein [Streptomyces noursei]|uniref:hypothetical protein n=1 Tax=Streptomyces noursei TaxID=1971 RepID=UPI0023B7DAD4|nr:hypothetical protein [Streptomyces noursei]
MPHPEPHPAPEPSEPSDQRPAAADPAAGPPPADCVECGKPTAYPATTPGIVRCPVCEWQEAQRTACSG